MSEQLSFTDQLFGIAKRTEPEAKKEGMQAAETAAGKKGYDLEEIRKWARHYIYSNQSMRDIDIPNVVWSDKVREHFNIRSLSGTGNNFMGSIFRGFVFTGEWIKTRTEGCHNRVVRLWTLKQYIIDKARHE